MSPRPGSQSTVLAGAAAGGEGTGTSLWGISGATMRRDPLEGLPDAPLAELNRSPSARAVGELAAASQLVLSHFEHRAALEPPEAWLPPDRPDLGDRPVWGDGILLEGKYTSFRQDSMVASFHPGHAPKWTAHELLHPLVGFAWHKNPTRFFLAMGARLAELLPVTLYYFLDEAFLSRCEAHRDLGPLYAVYCSDCEKAAAEGPRRTDARAEQYLEEGTRFFERELRAVERSIKLGAPVASPFGSIDLCSDALAYIGMQGDRLKSADWAWFMERFYGMPGTGCHADLESLIARARALFSHLVGQGRAEPWSVPRALWMVRDVAARVLEVRVQCEGTAADALQGWLETLAESPTLATLETAIRAYEALSVEYELPDPGELFAVGYRLPAGYGRSKSQLEQGIHSACPRTYELLGRTGQRREAVDAFSEADSFERVPLGRRFSAFVQKTLGGEAGELALVEAAITHAPPADAGLRTLSREPARAPRYRRSPDVGLVEAGPFALKKLGIRSPGKARVLLAIQRSLEGRARVYPLSPAHGSLIRALDAGAVLPLDEDLKNLIQQGLVIPMAYEDQPSMPL